MQVSPIASVLVADARPVANTPALAYRPGDYIGTPQGQLVFEGAKDDGYLHVRSRTSSYRVPTHLRSRDEIRAWAIDAVHAGAIGTPKYSRAAARALLPQSQPVRSSGAQVSRPGNYQSSDVNALFNRVRRAFSDGVMWRSELTQIAQAVAAASPSERRALVNVLANERSGAGTLLSRWLSEVHTSGIGAYGPMEDAARRALLGQLVEGQDVANLVRVFDGLRSRDPDDTNVQSFQREYLRALEQRGNDAQREGLAARLAARAVRGDHDAARGAAVLLADAPNVLSLQRMIGRLDRPSIDAIVVGAARPNVSSLVAGAEVSSTLVTFDMPLFSKLMVSVARLPSSTAAAKGAFVAACQGAFEQVDRSLNGLTQGAELRDTKIEIATAMTSLIGSDTTAVIENTLQQTGYGTSRSNGRQALKSYTGALLDARDRRTGALGAITASLQTGDGTQAPAQWLGRSDVRGAQAPAHIHARVMGNWLGIVSSAVQSRIASRDQNAAFSALIFSGATDVLKELVNTPAVKLAAAVAKPAANAALLTWRAALRRDDVDFSRALYEAALPRTARGESTENWVSVMEAAFSAGATRQ